jgi:hypothetical protein
MNFIRNRIKFWEAAHAKPQELRKLIWDSTVISHLLWTECTMHAPVKTKTFEKSKKDTDTLLSTWKTKSIRKRWVVPLLLLTKPAIQYNIYTLAKTIIKVFRDYIKVLITQWLLHTIKLTAFVLSRWLDNTLRQENWKEHDFHSRVSPKTIITYAQ